MLRSALLFFATCAVASSLTPFPTPVRGVNLGGWFVLESWIYPTWWDSASGGKVPQGQGEWQFCQILGSSACKTALEGHWDSWLTENDLDALANAGINALRIPIGYWILGGSFIAPGEPYVSGGWPYLERALGWAKARNFSVLLDLHGAPGSQNGHDNSGRVGPIDWPQPENVARTIAVLAELAKRAVVINSAPATLGVVAGLELLNEPWTTAVGGPISFSLLSSFYTNATAAVRQAGFDGAIVAPDGWNLSWTGWRNFMPDEAAQGTFLLDTHQYLCFGGFDDLKLRWQQPLIGVCGRIAPGLAAQNGTPPLLVGEWSQCMPNGASTPYTADDTAVMRVYAESQLGAYGSVVPLSSSSLSPSSLKSGNAAPRGSFFWNFKTESAPEWSLLSGLAGSYFPRASDMPAPPGNSSNSFFTCDALGPAALSTSSAVVSAV